MDQLETPSLAAKFSRFDDHGNGIHQRVLPDGRQFYVIKNSPSEDELSALLRNWTSDLRYATHSGDRWSVSYKLPV